MYIESFYSLKSKNSTVIFPSEKGYLSAMFVRFFHSFHRNIQENINFLNLQHRLSTILLLVQSSPTHPFSLLEHPFGSTLSSLLI